MTILIGNVIKITHADGKPRSMKTPPQIRHTMNRIQNILATHTFHLLGLLDKSLSLSAPLALSEHLILLLQAEFFHDLFVRSTARKRSICFSTTILSWFIGNSTSSSGSMPSSAPSHGERTYLFVAAVGAVVINAFAKTWEYEWWSVKRTGENDMDSGQLSFCIDGIGVGGTSVLSLFTTFLLFKYRPSAFE